MRSKLISLIALLIVATSVMAPVAQAEALELANGRSSALQVPSASVRMTAAASKFLAPVWFEQAAAWAGWTIERALLWVRGLGFEADARSSRFSKEGSSMDPDGYKAASTYRPRITARWRWTFRAQ